MSRQRIGIFYLRKNPSKLISNKSQLNMVVCPKDLFSYYQILFAYIELHSKQEKKNHFVMKISKF